MKLKILFYIFTVTVTIIAMGCHNSESTTQMGPTASARTPLAQDLLRMDYNGFTLWMDCDRRSAVRFEYNALKDTDNHKRHSSVYHDPGVPKRCQQTSTASYKAGSGRRYDRGHMFPANHGDSDKLTIKQSNFMTNVLPQAANMNRGTWLETEEIVECYRNLEPLHVFGGALWEKPMPDSFRTHGLVEIPSSYWKVILRGKQAIAWIIPNIDEAKRHRLDDY